MIKTAPCLVWSPFFLEKCTKSEVEECCGRLEVSGRPFLGNNLWHKDRWLHSQQQQQPLVWGKQKSNWAVSTSCDSTEAQITTQTAALEAQIENQASWLLTVPPTPFDWQPISKNKKATTVRSGRKKKQYGCEFTPSRDYIVSGLKSGGNIRRQHRSAQKQNKTTKQTEFEFCVEFACFSQCRVGIPPGTLVFPINSKHAQ